MASRRGVDNRDVTDAQEFRWRFYDADIGDTWSAWHVTNGPCVSCCCDGPDDGEHLEQAVYYEDELPVFSGHARLDPRDIDSWVTVEWRQPPPEVR